MYMYVRMYNTHAQTLIMYMYRFSSSIGGRQDSCTSTLYYLLIGVVAPTYMCIPVYIHVYLCKLSDYRCD